MNKQSLNDLGESDLEEIVGKKYKERDKKKKRTMKVNGGRVRDLQRIIKDKM